MAFKRLQAKSIKMEFANYVQSEEEFLESYPKAKENWKAANVKWDELETIRTDYIKRMPSLQGTATAFGARLQTIPGVHLTGVRVKHPDHLLAKIVRKRTIDRPIHIGNYFAEITDLIGARAIHIFKADWERIHQVIKETWHLHEDPKAYIRTGDDTSLYEKNKVVPETHPFNYRSVHYLAKTEFTMETHIVEVQVRTIYEEAWGEIDHELRYPDFAGNSYLEKSSALLNLMSGSADELASLIQHQRAEALDWQEDRANYETEKQNIDDAAQKAKVSLAELIQNSASSEDDKRKMLEQVESIPSSKPPIVEPLPRRTRPTGAVPLPRTSAILTGLKGLEDLGKMHRGIAANLGMMSKGVAMGAAMRPYGIDFPKLRVQMEEERARTIANAFKTTNPWRFR